MKKIMSVSLVVLCVMILAPLVALNNGNQVKTAAKSVKIPVAKEAASESFILSNIDTGKNEKISAEDYIFGVVAAEMPALYDEEALKAQAVAAYTYACVKKVQNADKSYDITNDHNIDQGYVSREDARDRWGENADTYTEKIEKAIKNVSGYMVTYEGKPALTVYHAISSGKTESAENVWGRSYPYLVASNSSGDTLSPNYISVKTVSLKELVDALMDEKTASGDPAEYFKNAIKTESGTVKTIEYCEKEITGSKIRSIFDLRSSCFDIEYADGDFKFTVYGYGHGVGMSQYGADYMAKQGSDFKEILENYYKGCKIEKI